MEVGTHTLMQTTCRRRAHCTLILCMLAIVLSAFNICSFQLQSHDRLIGSWVTLMSDAYKAKPLPRSEVIQESPRMQVCSCV